MTLTTTAFWQAALERAVKAFAAALVALLVGDGTGLIDTAWTHDLSVAGMAAVVSLLLSVGSDAVTGGGPSLTNAETVTPTVAPTTPAKKATQRRAAKKAAAVDPAEHQD